jgi:hypothetical protein
VVRLLGNDFVSPLSQEDPAIALNPAFNYFVVKVSEGLIHLHLAKGLRYSTRVQVTNCGFENTVPYFCAYLQQEINRIMTKRLPFQNLGTRTCDVRIIGRLEDEAIMFM